jgi:hypothetical protein
MKKLQASKLTTVMTELDSTPVDVVQTMIVLKPITGMDHKKVAVSVNLKLIF